MTGSVKQMRMGLLAALFAVVSVVPAPGVGAVAPTESTETPQESILITPVNKRYELKAGTTRADSVKVFNDGQEDYNFIVYARPYSIDADDEAYVNPNFTDQTDTSNAYKWVQFEKASYFIKAGQTVDVNYTLRVPNDAEPGGHYGVLFAETQPADDTEGTGVKRKKRVGAIMYVTVDGDLRLSGALKSISVPTFQFRPPLTTSNRVENDGNTDFIVDSQVRVLDAFGQVKYDATKQHTVLPGTTREIKMDWDGPSWIGFYRVESTVNFLDTDRKQTSYVLLVPVWVYATLALLIAGRILYAVANRKKR